MRKTADQIADDVLESLRQQALKDPWLQDAGMPADSSTSLLPLKNDAGEIVGIHAPAETPKRHLVGAVFVAPEHRGKGHATAALRSFRESHKDKPIWSLVHPKNEASKALHRKAGFKNTEQFSPAKPELQIWSPEEENKPNERRDQEDPARDVGALRR